jgi:phosphoglycerol geranylgeranyltransferase
VTLLRKLREDGPGLLVLVDPERTAPDDAARVAVTAAAEGARGLLLGTSWDGAGRTAEVATAVKEACDLPLLLFPGSAAQLVPQVDAVLLLSLVSGRNPQYLIEEHVRAVPFFLQHRVPAISTAYLLVDGGRVTTVESVSQTRPLPADKPELAAAHAIAARMIGMAAVYLDAGSGAARPVAPAVIAAVRAAVPLPIIVGGGLRAPAQVREAFAAGADLAVVGSAVEADGPSAVRAFAEAARSAAR